MNHPYRLEREVVALSESRRVESQWTLTRVYDEKSGVGPLWVPLVKRSFPQGQRAVPSNSSDRL